MARTKDTPLAPAQGEGLSPEAQMQVVAAQASALTDAQNDEILAAGMDLGRLEALTFITTVGESAALNIYENVKKSKAWRYLRNPGSSHGGNFESLDEFCRVKLGKSYNRLQTLALSRNTIGQEAFEQAERIGLRQVDFNAIKALPAPDQELISQALRAEATKDEVLNTLQELAARHAKEKEALIKENLELAAEREADAALLKDRRKTIDELQREVAKRTVAGTDWPEQFVGLHDQVSFAARTMKVQIGALDAVREKAMQVEAANYEEEGGLQRAREALADEMAKTHALCAQYLEAFAHTFEKTLGAYATAGVQS